MRLVWLATLIACCSLAQAQDWPARPVRIVVPWPPGGTTDVAGRVIAERLAGRLGQSVVVENRGGATGMIGATAVAQAPADGYTLLVASAETHAINPYTYRKLTYDPARDLTLVSPFVINPFSVVVRGDSPAGSLGGLIELAKANPGKFSYSSAGLGSASQLAMEMLKTEASFELLHVPFQGEAPAVTALVGGQVDAQILPAGRAAALAKSGKLKVLALTTGERFFGLPEVPTLRESGFDKLAIANWFALAAPAQTQATIVQRLYNEVQTIIATPEARERFRAMGVDVYPPVSRDAFLKFVASESARWGDVIKRSGVQLDK